MTILVVGEFNSKSLISFGLSKRSFASNDIQNKFLIFLKNK